MEPINKILVALDFSEHSPQVMNFAVQMAKDMRAELILVNVINKRDIDAVSMVERQTTAITVDKYIETQKKDRSQEMDQLLQQFDGANLAAKKVFKIGVPAKEILQVIREEAADVLVMGARGRSNLADMLFGSTAEHVFRRCPVPLVSVRP